MKKLILGAILSAVAGGGFIATRGGSPAAPAAGNNAVALRGDFKVAITEQGTFAANKSISIRIEPEAYNGQLTITQVVGAGTGVKKGDLLISFDDSELQQQISRADIEVQTAKNDVVQATQDYRIQQADNRLNIERAEFGLTSSEMNLKKWGDLEAPKAIKEQEARITEAQNTFDEADSNYKALQKMKEEDLASESDVRRAELAAKKAESDLEFHKLSLRLMREYDHPLQTKRLENDVRDAKSLLEARKSAVEALTAQKQSAVLRSESALQQKTSQLEKLKHDLDRLKVTAPVEGIILYGDPNQGWVDPNFKVAVGEKMSFHRTILTLPDLSGFKVKIGVNEADINKVKPGLPATVKPEALPDLTMKATIKTVSTVAGNSRWWQPDSSSKFDVELELDGVDPRLKPGMKCKVEVSVEEVKSVLNIPLDAVFDKDGKTVCYVVTSLKPEERLVKVGRSSSDVVEILEGLKEGEKVALYDPTKG